MFAFRVALVDWTKANTLCCENELTSRSENGRRKIVFLLPRIRKVLFADGRGSKKEEILLMVIESAVEDERGIDRT